MVGDACMGVVEVVAVCPNGITDVAAGGSWGLAAAMTPRVTMPLAAIAAACHLSHRFCISPPSVGLSFGAWPPSETVLRYRQAYHCRLGL